MTDLMYVKHPFYPDTIPKKRSKHLTFLSLHFVYVVLLIVGCVIAGNNVPSLIVIFVSTDLFLASVCELIYRLCLLPEELRHLRSRYKDDIRMLLEYLDPFILTLTFIMSLMMLVFFGYFHYNEDPGKIYRDFKPLLAFLCCVRIFLLHIILNLHSFPLNNNLAIEKLRGIDYGSGMAYSFFYGYLKLILPNTGGADKDLHELLLKYEDIEYVKFAVYKLFILIPLSGYCPPSLENGNNPTIEESKSLEEKSLSVAGVKNRIYKNSIYKINVQGKEKVYVCAEYATPVKTLHNVLGVSSVYTESYKLHKDEIYLQFYLTLKKILQENPDCCHLCELIFFDDQVINEHGDIKYRDVAPILLDRINELKIR